MLPLLTTRKRKDSLNNSSLLLAQFNILLMLVNVTQTFVKPIQLVYKSRSRLCNSTDLMTSHCWINNPQTTQRSLRHGIGGQRNKQPMLLWQSRCLYCLLSPFGIRVNNTMTHTSRPLPVEVTKDTEPSTCRLVGWVSRGMIAVIKQREECSVFNCCSLLSPSCYRIWHRDISAIPRLEQSWQTQNRRCTKDSHDSHLSSHSHTFNTLDHLYMFCVIFTYKECLFFKRSTRGFKVIKSENVSF